MKRALLAAALLVSLAAVVIARGRPNRVWHSNGDSGYFIDASAGSCRHHLRAHPGDTVDVSWGAPQHDENYCQ